MTTFWREGHYRTSQNGLVHWVEGHYVDRGDWWSGWAYAPATVARATGATIAPGTWVDPTARCPVCGAEVFFYSNSYGSRVYFDDLGPPWPKHPCTDTSLPRSPSANVARSRGDSGLRERLVIDEANDLVHLPGVFIVRAVAKQGPKRVVTMQEIGGEAIDILISPPPPPVDSIAIALSFELHWFDPTSGEHGKNYVWQRRAGSD